MRRYRGRRRSRLKTVGVIGGLLLVGLAAACVVYLRDYRSAEAEALAALESDEQVTVLTEGKNTVFAPVSGADCGFIFYPGGKVEHTAYAPLLRQLAEEGTLCVLTEMPFHLAVLDVNAAKGIPEQYPEVTDWYIGGHSLGGSMAASYVEKHGGEYEGLVLLASYSTADLSGTELRVLSVYGSEDGVLNLEKYGEYQENLPESTVETVIDGGNHACFGSYGSQDGDGTAQITAEQQIEETVECLTAFFREESPAA